MFFFSAYVLYMLHCHQHFHMQKKHFRVICNDIHIANLSIQSITIYKNVNM